MEGLGPLGAYHASARGQLEAVFDGKTRLTWGEVGDLVERYAAGLAAHGVRRGDRVGVFLKNCTEYLILVQACMRIGAIFVPLNVRLSAPELAYVLEDAECAVHVTEHALGEVAERATKGRQVRWHYLEDSLAELLAADAPTQLAEVTWSDVLILGYTSGTTGKPKGAMLTHGNLQAIILNWLTTRGLTEDDRALIAFSLSFTAGIVANVMPLYAVGGSIVLEREFDPARALRLIEHERITTMAAVPTIYERIAREPGFNDADFSSLRICTVGGMSVPLPLLDVYETKGIVLRPGYGLTEAGAVNVWMPPEHARRKFGTTGLPGPWMEARVVDEAGRDVAAGKPGELLLRGPEVMAGYWRDQAATEATLAGGWLHTRDIVTCDDEAFISVIDRKDDMFVSGGINVYPAEVEHAMREVPGIADVAVIGVADERWGHVGQAFVALDGTHEMSDEDVRFALRDRIAGYKIPQHVTFVDALPRTVSDKVRKRELGATHVAGGAGV